MMTMPLQLGITLAWILPLYLEVVQSPLWKRRDRATFRRAASLSRLLQSYFYIMVNPGRPKTLRLFFVLKNTFQGISAKS